MRTAHNSHVDSPNSLPDNSSIGHTSQAAEVLAEVEAALTTPLETATDRYVAAQPYTACALAQIAVWLREHDDATGANLIAQFAREFAAYEASTL